MQIKDSGERKSFTTGAVRDISDGKGRCDLIPLDVLADYYEARRGDHITAHIFKCINSFIYDGDVMHLLITLTSFMDKHGYKEPETMFLEVSKHYEDGAKKYSERNWENGLPLSCYISSAVRHYLKYLRGDTDEPHDRAFVWNILGAIWTRLHFSDNNDICNLPCSCNPQNIPSDWLEH